MEWGEYGIRVNTLSPGYFLTQMLQNLFNDYPDRREKWPTENMLGRLNKPSEYGGAAVFLLSDARSYMTSVDLRIDGGHAAWLGLIARGLVVVWTKATGSRNKVGFGFSSWVSLIPGTCRTRKNGLYSRNIIHS
jgi:hypothetical protein